MLLDAYPDSLQHLVLLEWLSPKSVWVAAQASESLRQCVLSAAAGSTAVASSAPNNNNNNNNNCTTGFRAAQGEVLSPPCIRWFRDQGVPLRLWICVDKGTDDLGTYEHHRSNGKLHRDDNDLPAVIRSDGFQAWFQDNRYHRDGDRPAVVWPSGAKEWYQHGKLHRDGDRPAIELVNGGRQFYRHGVQYDP